MISICKNNSVNSFFGLPPSMEEDHFSHAFHQTSCHPSLPPQQNPTFIFNSFNPIKPINLLDSNPSLFAEKTDNSGSIDLMSCTENLGFESSDEMITSFDDLGYFKNSNSRNKNDESSSSSSTSSSSSSCLNDCLLRRRREKMVSKSEFPPPLTTLDENRRRNFVMKSVRENGRLKIVGVMIQRPETLCATRSNGRLRLNLVQSASSSDSESSSSDDDDGHDIDVNDDDEKDLKIPASGVLRRCCDHHQQHQHVWGPQQNRCVTTI